jgi:hypothetical protein
MDLIVMTVYYEINMAIIRINKPWDDTPTSESKKDSIVRCC